MPKVLADMNVFMVAWLIVFVFFLVMELMTMRITSIWFSVGALAAFGVAAFGGPVWLQIIIFWVVLMVLVMSTRTWVKSYLRKKRRAQKM